ncbi:MerR family transcriptional regulator [Nocardioides taihuensis]|uniref:MerR family transcriptional regulator n=1 Tax=Nocardioides taihuensis TaxID=1835606 RepID=A0ABW0BJ45_9ACTN
MAASTSGATVGHSVRQVAALTGIPPDTLRAWERRYGVVTPGRSASGYRVYDDAAVRRLAAMRALVEAGCPPREAAQRVSSGTTVGPVTDSADGARAAGARGPGGELAGLATGVDVAALGSVLDAAFAAPFEEVVDDWLMPELERLGEAWAAGRVPVGGEHFVSAAVQRRVSGVLETAQVPPGAPRVVVGLAGGCRHELGVLSFAALLRRRGVDAIYLAGDLPPESWVVTVPGPSVAAVVLGVPMAEDAPATREALAALAAAYPGLPLHAGGRHQDAVADLAHPLGHHLATAARELVASLHATP